MRFSHLWHLVPFHRSLIHAVSGIHHAIRTEKVLPVVALGCTVVVLLGFAFRVTRVEWMVLLLGCAMTLTTELLNTALERFIDAFDDHAKRQLDNQHFAFLKAAKDVSAGAALLCGTLSFVASVIVFWPYIGAS